MDNTMELQMGYDFNKKNLHEKYLSRLENKVKTNRLNHLFHPFGKKKTQNPSKTSLLSLQRNVKVAVEPIDLKKEPFIMKHKISERLIELSQPRRQSIKTIDPKKDLSSVMIYETSPRLLELAKPKRIEKLQPKEIYHIPQKVLRAQASTRIVQLSQPRKRNNRCANPKNKKNMNKSKVLPEIGAPRSTSYSANNVTSLRKKRKDFQLPWLHENRRDSVGLDPQTFSSKSGIIKVKRNRNIILTKPVQNAMKLRGIVEKRPVFK